MIFPLYWLVFMLSVIGSNASTARDGISTIRGFIASAMDGFSMEQSPRELNEAVIVEAIRHAEQNMPSHSTRFPFDSDSSPREPVMSYGRMMAAKTEAAAVAKNADMLLEATRLLVEEFGPTVIQELQHYDASRLLHSVKNDCIPENLPCDEAARFRSYSGWCNNLLRPSTGNAFQPLIHLLPPLHTDGLGSPKVSVLGGPLPNPRVISNSIHHESPNQSNKISLLLMQFGQMIDHEITHSPVEQSADGTTLNCRRCDSHTTVSEFCLPIPVPRDDPHFGPLDGETKCLTFVRSLSGQRTLGGRQQMNQITAFLDGSVIYGSTNCEADALRTFRGGAMKTTAGGSHLGVLLPQSRSSECRSLPSFPCFQAGDDRNSQQPGLASLQAVWLRHHNKLAAGLAKRNRHWEDERLYQESRRILSAQFVHVVYSEFLPIVIGDSAMSRYGLRPQHQGYFQGYDSSCDAAISQPFSTAAFRFEGFNSNFIDFMFYARLDPFFNNGTSPVDLIDNFNNMESIYDGENGGIDSLLMGLIGSSSMAFDRHISTAVRNHLFARRGQPNSGMDLVSINIQRGRDHAVQGYNAHRELCGQSRASSFSGLSASIPFETVEVLEDIYAHVDDVDLFTGLLAERPANDAVVGPTTACLLAEQFGRLKNCDRFFYENEGSQAFTPDQLNEIRRSSMAQILCATGRLQMAQNNVFLLPDTFMNNPQPCSEYPPINLDLWNDRQ